jgi:hypothetical protein
VSPTETKSSSGSISGYPTPSQSTSQEPSSSQTPSVSQSRSQSSSHTRSKTQTASQSPTLSRTPSQTKSGFPLAPVVDNTNRVSGDINVESHREISVAKWRGIVTFWPERDPACGPGQYRLSNILLPLSASTESTVVFNFVLFTTENVSLFPLEEHARVSASVVVPTDPNYVNIALPSSLIVNTLQSQFFAILWYADSTVSWYDVRNVAGDVPTSGFADAVASVSSSDSGLSFDVDSPYAGLLLFGVKLVCSPSNTQSMSRSQSATASMSQTASLSASITLTPSQSLSLT